MDSRERRGQPAWFMSLTGCSGQDRQAGERRGNGPSEDRSDALWSENRNQSRALEGPRPGPPTVARAACPFSGHSRVLGERGVMPEHLGGEADTRGEWAPAQGSVPERPGRAVLTGLGPGGEQGRLALRAPPAWEAQHLPPGCELPGGRGFGWAVGGGGGCCSCCPLVHVSKAAQEWLQYFCF